jgi:hypothetical protein
MSSTSKNDAILRDTCDEPLRGPFSVVVIDDCGTCTTKFSKAAEAYSYALECLTAHNVVELLATRSTSQDYVWCRVERGGRKTCFFTNWRPWGLGLTTVSS